MSNTCLFKQIDARTFVRFDPATNDYRIVRADAVPLLVPIARPVRLSASVLRADPFARLRQVVVLAMLDVQERAASIGDATSACRKATS
jgi:hypothetical protein